MEFAVVFGESGCGNPVSRWLILTKCGLVKFNGGRQNVKAHPVMDSRVRKDVLSLNHPAVKTLQCLFTKGDVCSKGCSANEWNLKLNYFQDGGVYSCPHVIQKGWLRNAAQKEQKCKGFCLHNAKIPHAYFKSSSIQKELCKKQFRFMRATPC